MTASAPSPVVAATPNCWKTIGVWGDHSCPQLAGCTHCRNCAVYSAVGRALLDGDLSEENLADATAEVARTPTPRVIGLQSVLIFRIGSEWFAVPALACAEISERRLVHSVPHAPSRVVKGLVNIHGSLLLCVTLREFLQLPERDGAAKQVYRATERMIVLTQQGQRLVFPVSEVIGLHRYHPSELREVPATLSHVTARFTESVLPWRNVRYDQEGMACDEISVGLLDVKLIFYSLNRSLT